MATATQDPSAHPRRPPVQQHVQPHAQAPRSASSHAVAHHSGWQAAAGRPRPLLHLQAGVQRGPGQWAGARRGPPGTWRGRQPAAGRAVPQLPPGARLQAAQVRPTCSMQSAAACGLLARWCACCCTCMLLHMHAAAHACCYTAATANQQGAAHGSCERPWCHSAVPLVPQCGAPGATHTFRPHCSISAAPPGYWTDTSMVA